MNVTDVSLSAAFKQHVSAAKVEVKQAESFFSNVQAQMKSGASIPAQTAQDAKDMARHLDMLGSAMAVEGINSNVSDEEVQRNIDIVESAAAKLNTLAQGMR